MMKYARRRWDDVEGCEDVVVDALFIAWQKWRDRPDETLERAWLYGITFRVLANLRRARDRRQSLFVRLAMERTEENVEVDTVGTRSIRLALSKLRSNERELLRLLYWEDLSHREVAQAMGITENAVAIRVTRSRSKLRNLLVPPE